MSPIKRSPGSEPTRSANAKRSAGPYPRTTLREVHFDQRIERSAGPDGATGEASGRVLPRHRLHHVGVVRDPVRGARLQCPDVVPGDAGDLRTFAPELLDVVLAQRAHARLRHPADRFDPDGLGHRHERDVAGIAAGSGRGLRDPAPDLVDVPLDQLPIVEHRPPQLLAAARLRTTSRGGEVLPGGGGGRAPPLSDLPAPGRGAGRGCRFSSSGSPGCPGPPRRRS